MKLKEVVEILKADVIWATDMDLEIKTACGSDMMSDALAYVKDQALLLTGLMNAQTIRTAEMLDMHCVVFVRGKTPGEDIVELARERNIALLSSQYRMFTACGRLYSNGLGGGSEEV